MDVKIKNESTITKKKKVGFGFQLLVIFFFLAIGIGTSGYHYYKKQETRFREATNNQLEAVADLKVKEIAYWRDRRLEDATIIMKQSSFTPYVQQWLKYPNDSELKEKVSVFLNIFRDNKNYKTIILTDAQGNTRLLLPQESHPLSTYKQQQVANALQTKKIIFSDLHRDEATDSIYVAIFVPLFSSSKNEGPPFGVIVLEIDPYQFLYPLIQTWPTPSKTAETLLVRKEGAGVLFLNELRHRKNTALTLRLPISRKDLPAAMAARGIEGVTEGIDYRGKSVLAAFRKMPDSSWLLVAKIDRQEVYGLIKKQTQLMAIIVLLLILFFGVGLGFLWRQQSAKFYKKQLEADRKSIESQEDLDRAQAVGNIGSWRLDIQRNNLTWSDENHRIFGIPKETPMTYETFLSTVHPDDRNYVDTKWKECLAGKPYDIEHRIIVDGHVKLVREKAYLEFDSQGALVGGFGITQDITERKEMENAIRQARDELESRVQERTAELKGVVEALQDEMTERKQAEEALGAERQRFNDVLEILPVYVVLLTPDYHVSFANRFFRKRFGESHGRRCFEYLFERSEPCEICDTYTVLETKAPHHWEWTGPDGRNYDIFDFPFTDTDGSPLILEMGIDITERKQAEKKLKATNALLSLFSQKPSRKEYLDAVVDLIHSWTGYRCVGIRILDDKGYIPYESYIGFGREFWESESRLSIEHAQCVCMRVITGNPDPQDVSMMTPGGSFHCEDTVAFVGRLSPEEKARFRGVCIQNGFLSLSIVPVRYGNKILGSIQLADEKRKKLSLPFIEFLELMSPLIGEAVNRFNLEDEIRESESHLRLLSSQLLTVQEDERKRISAELHDDIAAKLAGIKFSLEKRLMETDEKNKKMSQSLRDIVSLVLETIASTRRIMINLRPAMIDDLGILATLNWSCREFEQIFTTIQIEKQVKIEEIEIPDHLKIVIFRIVQEGMNNIAKHSGANHISLALEKINDTLALSIEDNGRGFDVENKTLVSEMFHGFGIINMQERTRLSGGEFSIKSFKEKGTSIKVTWSLKPIAMDYHLRIEPS